MSRTTAAKRNRRAVVQAPLGQVPRIRFKGNSDEWITKKLGQISDRVCEKNVARKVDETFTNSAEFGVISQRDFFDHDISNVKNLSGYYVVVDDDFVYNPRMSVTAPVGPINRCKLGRKGVMSPLYSVFRPHDIDFSFLEYYFKTRNWHRFMWFNGDTGARGDRFSIKKDVFVEMPIPSPCNADEQRLVGDWFTSFDILISSASARREKLRSVKKSMLVKMFPQGKAKIPEIRFKGFRGEWRACALSEYLEPSGARNVSGRFSRDQVLSVSGEYGIVNQIKFKGRSFAGASIANYRVVETGDVVYTKSPLNSNPYGIVKANGGEAGVVSTLYAVYKPRENCVASFVQTYFDLDQRLNRYLRPLVRKGAKNDMKVSSEGALLGEVVFPSVDEQRKIAAFFTELDRMISAAEKKVAKLKQVKASLLERMFVEEARK